MLGKLITGFWLCMFLAPMPLWADQSDGRVIISRQHQSIDIYWQVPGEQLHPLTGADPAFLMTDAGLIDLDTFRVDTAAYGDQLFELVQFTLNDQPVKAESISLTMHGDDDPLVPFDTPWDALTAVTLCTAPENSPHRRIEMVRTYVGFSLYPVDERGNIAIIPPVTQRGDLRFEVLEYANGQRIAERLVTLKDGDALRFAFNPQRAVTTSGLFWILGAIGATGFAFARLASYVLTRRRLVTSKD